MGSRAIARLRRPVVGANRATPKWPCDRHPAVSALFASAVAVLPYLYTAPSLDGAVQR